MDSISSKVSIVCRYDPSAGCREATVEFGKDVKVYVSEADRHLTESLSDGSCSVSMDEANYGILDRHKLCQFSDTSNPGIMAGLRAIFLNPLTDREVSGKEASYIVESKEDSRGDVMVTVNVDDDEEVMRLLEELNPPPSDRSKGSEKSATAEPNPLSDPDTSDSGISDSDTLEEN